MSSELYGTNEAEGILLYKKGLKLTISSAALITGWKKLFVYNNFRI